MIDRVFGILNEVCSGEHLNEKVMLDELEDAREEFGSFGFRAELDMLAD